MAVTSIWSIKGWIGKVINYAENSDKTKENNEGRISENQSRSTQGLNDVITYAVNAEKIRRRQFESMEMELVGEAEELMEQYVSGVNCAPTTAREELLRFMATSLLHRENVIRQWHMRLERSWQKNCGVVSIKC